MWCDVDMIRSAWCFSYRYNRCTHFPSRQLLMMLYISALHGNSRSTNCLATRSVRLGPYSSVISGTITFVFSVFCTPVQMAIVKLWFSFKNRSKGYVKIVKSNLFLVMLNVWIIHNLIYIFWTIACAQFQSCNQCCFILKC